MAHRRSLNPARTAVELGGLLGARRSVTVLAAPFDLRRGVNGAFGPAGCAPRPSLLVVGAVLRTVRLRQRLAGTLHLAGDVLPAERDEPGPFEVRWRVLESGRAVVLDTTTLAAVADSPAIVGALAERIARQADATALQGLIAQLVGIEERLAVLLPSLSARVGTVTGQGVLLPAFLSHDVLSALIGVRRPSLTVAAAALADRGLLERLPDRRWRVDQELAGVA